MIKNCSLDKLYSLKMTRSYCPLHSKHRKVFECCQISEFLILHFPIIGFPYHKFPLNETRASGVVAEELFVATSNRLPAIIWVCGCGLEWMHYGVRNSTTFQYTLYFWVICSRPVYLQGLTMCLCSVLKYQH